MKVKETKTITISVSGTELEQLALIGINAIMQTSNPLVSGLEDKMYKSRYEEIARSCSQLDNSILATMANVRLSNYDNIKVVLDK